MFVSLILANPKPQSFCHALAESASNACANLGYDVRFHDLYAEEFQPILGSDELAQRCSKDPLVERHCAEAAEADAFIVIHPNWWGQPPAILKGWVDRVLRSGVGFEFEEGDGGEGVPKGLLRAKTAIVLNTTDTPMEREQSVFGDPLEAIWGRCIFPYCGVQNFLRRSFGVVVNSRAEERQTWLSEADQLVRRTLGA